MSVIGSFSHPPIPPISFQKAMVFIDGSNLRYRMQDFKIKIIKPIADIGKKYISSRQLIRTYFYTSEPHLEALKKIHGNDALKGLEVILGSAIPQKDGNYKEKGVDALLVADLIYHAAMKNYDYALVMSTDQGFAWPIKRVQDFGCQTGVLSLFHPVPEKLENVCDESVILYEQNLLSDGIGIKINPPS